MTIEPNARTALIAGLPADEILARYERAPGEELSEKFASSESSAALVANVFGFFLHRPTDLPPLPGWTGAWHPTRLVVEEELRFPWRGGRHPWLDVVVETDTQLIGIESKRYEPFRSSKHGSFSSAYWRPVWGREMGPFEWLRDGLRTRPDLFERLDAVQLVKHAFGLRTQAHATRPRKSPVLVYLYSEPKAWPAREAIPGEHLAQHAEEVRYFARLVRGAEVDFVAVRYQQLLSVMALSPSPDVRKHAATITSRFDV